MTAWTNRIFSSTGGGSTNGYRSSRPIERFTMFSDQANGSHRSMIVSNPLGPSTLRSNVAPAGANPNAAAVSRVSRMCR
jgi:hypothetical protein